MNGKSLYVSEALLSQAMCRDAGYEIHRPHIRHTLCMLSLLLCAVYLVVLPGGLSGVALGLLCFGLVCPYTNYETFGVFCLLLGPSLFGQLARAFGISHVGGPASLLLGAFLCYGLKSERKIASANWRGPLVWLIVTVGVLVVSYCYGPRTPYSLTKLMLFSVRLLLGIMALRLVMASKSIDVWGLGILAVVAGVLHMSLSAYSWPDIMPETALMPSGMRPPDPELTRDARPAYAGAISCFGLMCMLANSVRKKFEAADYIQVLLAWGIAIVVVSCIGQRLYLAITFASGLLLLFAAPADKAFQKIAVTAIWGACVLVVLAGFSREVEQYTQAFTSERVTLIERLNRDLNWNSAGRRIKERPFFGHGLGGYYLDTTWAVSDPGDGAYAHNLFLELLSETGIVGTTIILAPVLLCFLIPLGKRLLTMRTYAGDCPTFLLLHAFCHAMIVRDLRESNLLFAMTAVIWAYMVSGRRLRTGAVGPELARVPAIVEKRQEGRAN